MGNLRITGMATGMDTDTTIKQMMKPYQMRMDKAKQDMQKVQWKQDLYRDVIGDINTFKSTYFELLKPETNMLSSSNYGGFDVTSVDKTTPTATPGATATANVGAAAGNYAVKVEQIAKAATIPGGCISNNTIEVLDATKWAGEMKFNVDGVDTPIVLSAGADLNTLVNDINSKISGNASLKGKISLSIISGGSADKKGKIQINTSNGSSVKIVSSTLPADGGTIGELNKAVNPTTGTKLTDLGTEADMKKLHTFSLTYNGATKNISLDNSLGNKTVADLISEISSQTSGAVVASFSQLTGQFVLKTSTTGSATSISIDGTASIAKGLKLLSSSSGQDAKVTITPPGGTATTIIRATNNFTVDGITYNAMGEGSTTNMTVTANVQKPFDKIKTFIDKYNELIDKLGKKIEEKKAKGFEPLTEEQKKDMKPEDITKWEDKAKAGILRGDSSIGTMLDSMRSAFFQGVEGAGISLAEIGLTTSKDTTQRGKIVFDPIVDKNGDAGEARLKKTLQNSCDKVMRIFCKSSDISYSPDMSSSDRSIRNANEGIFQRLNDILSDNVRTMRDNNGNKGTLLVKAGVKGDFSEFHNLLTDDLIKRDKKISELQKSLADRESKYYSQFARLETAMNKLNAQSSWFAQQMGGGK